MIHILSRVELLIILEDPRGNFHSKTGELVQGLFFTLMYSNFEIGVKHPILLSRDCAEHFIGQRNPDDVGHVKIPFSFYCKKKFV